MITWDTEVRRAGRSWQHLLALFPGTITELGDALGSNRHSVWQLRTGQHRKVPHDLLARLAEILAGGTADGSTPPNRAEITAAWLMAFRKGSR